MLDLSELAEGRIPRITPFFSGVLAEAAGFCLESQGHTQGVNLLVRGHIEKDHSILWPPVNEEALQTYDADHATEFGATGIAVLLAKLEIGYDVIERSRKGTGIDYWLGNETETLPFQRRARLEVSGIGRGDESTVRARVRQKLKQTQRSDDVQLPAYVIVVEFGRPLAEVREK